MEEILKQARKVAEAAEVFMVSAEETSVQFEANRLKHIQSRQSQGLALRLLKGGRTGYATATKRDSRNLVEMALETARFGAAARFEFPPATTYPATEVFDPGVASIPTADMAERGEEMIATLRKHTPKLLCEAAVNKSTISVSILNSSGGEASYKKSVSSLGVEGQLVRGTDMLFVGESQSSCHPITAVAPITEVVIRQLELARDMAKAPTRTLPVIFTPVGIASTLLLPLMAAFNGKSVLEGASPIGGKLGKQVFDEGLSLRDDATIAFRPGSYPGDDEAVPGQRTLLIENGMVANFLYDLQTAALARTGSTGNGHRSHAGLPAPAPSTFVFSPGESSIDEMVNDIKEGLIVEYLMGAGQGNILGGDFSGNVLLGYKIENGKIVGRVKDTMVSGNIYQLLRQITAIGSEAKWVGSSLYTPPIYFPGVSVAAR